MEEKKETLIKLTSELYRLTGLFPKKDPLRYKMRDLAVEILAEFLTRSKSDRNHLEALKCCFEVAKSQNWASQNELLNLGLEYSKLVEEIKDEETPSSIKVESVSLTGFLPLRQKKILDLLREKKNFQVWQAKEFFPQISKRTLRRDFESLLKQGLVQRIGERNDTFYQLC